MHSVEAARRYYAQLVAGKGSVRDPRITAAFEAVPRETFVGAGPWTVYSLSGGYIDTPSNDPAYLYQDVLIALSREKGINNGSPNLHARCLDALGVRENDTILHIGAGTGYYTAILASLAGPKGSVVGYEIDPALVQKAITNLSGMPNVKIEGTSGTNKTLPSCDTLYVNAGATHPVDTWLDALRPYGRLLFPLTPDQGFGGMLLITRGPDRTYSARFVMPAAFIPCDGARTPEMALKVAEAFGRNMWSVRALHRDNTPDESCWLAGPGWWLSTRP